MNELWWASSVDYFRKYTDITPSPATLTPAVNRSCRRAKLTPRRRGGSAVCTDVHRTCTYQGMPNMGVVVPPTATLIGQMANMQLQINELHKFLQHLKPDGKGDIPMIVEELPPTATLIAQMAHMQRQIDELHRYIKKLTHDGVSENNGVSSDAARASPDKVILLTILLICLIICP